MEVKISRTLLYGIIGVILVSGVVWVVRRGNTTPATPYAGIAGADLPTVVGKSSLGGPKIPFTATENYKEYTPEVLATALASGKATLIYFYADWCGTCRGQEPINAAFFNHAVEKNLAITGIRVNVDENQTLMRQYRVNYQHSYVLLDTSGQPVDRFFGEHTLDALIQKVQQVL